MASWWEKIAGAGQVRKSMDAALAPRQAELDARNRLQADAPQGPRESIVASAGQPAPAIRRNIRDVVADQRRGRLANQIEQAIVEASPTFLRADGTLDVARFGAFTNEGIPQLASGPAGERALTFLAEKYGVPTGGRPAEEVLADVTTAVVGSKMRGEVPVARQRLKLPDQPASPKGPPVQVGDGPGAVEPFEAVQVGTPPPPAGPVIKTNPVTGEPVIGADGNPIPAPSSLITDDSGTYAAPQPGGKVFFPQRQYVNTEGKVVTDVDESRTLIPLSMTETDGDGNRRVAETMYLLERDDGSFQVVPAVAEPGQPPQLLTRDEVQDLADAGWRTTDDRIVLSPREIADTNAVESAGSSFFQNLKDLQAGSGNIANLAMDIDRIESIRQLGRADLEEAVMNRIANGEGAVRGRQIYAQVRARVRGGDVSPLRNEPYRAPAPPQVAPAATMAARVAEARAQAAAAANPSDPGASSRAYDRSLLQQLGVPNVKILEPTANVDVTRPNYYPIEGSSVPSPQALWRGGVPAAGTEPQIGGSPRFSLAFGQDPSAVTLSTQPAAAGMTQPSLALGPNGERISPPASAQGYDGDLPPSRSVNGLPSGVVATVGGRPSSATGATSLVLGGPQAGWQDTLGPAAMPQSASFDSAAAPSGPLLESMPPAFVDNLLGDLTSATGRGTPESLDALLAGTGAPSGFNFITSPGSWADQVSAGSPLEQLLTRPVTPFTATASRDATPLSSAVTGVQADPGMQPLAGESGDDLFQRRLDAVNQAVGGANTASVSGGAASAPIDASAFGPAIGGPKLREELSPQAREMLLKTAAARENAAGVKPPAEAAPPSPATAAREQAVNRAMSAVAEVNGLLGRLGNIRQDATTGEVSLEVSGRKLSGNTTARVREVMKSLAEMRKLLEGSAGDLAVSGSTQKATEATQGLFDALGSEMDAVSRQPAGPGNFEARRELVLQALRDARRAAEAAVPSFIDLSAVTTPKQERQVREAMQAAGRSRAQLGAMADQPRALQEAVAAARESHLEDLYAEQAILLDQLEALGVDDASGYKMIRTQVGETVNAAGGTEPIYEYQPDPSNTAFDPAGNPIYPQNMREMMNRLADVTSAIRESSAAGPFDIPSPAPLRGDSFVTTRPSRRTDTLVAIAIALRKQYDAARGDYGASRQQLGRSIDAARERPSADDAQVNQEEMRAMALADEVSRGIGAEPDADLADLENMRLALDPSSRPASPDQLNAFFQAGVRGRNTAAAASLPPAERAAILGRETQAPLGAKTLDSRMDGERPSKDIVETFARREAEVKALESRAVESGATAIFGNPSSPVAKALAEKQARAFSPKELEALEQLHLEASAARAELDEAAAAFSRSDWSKQPTDQATLRYRVAQKLFDPSSPQDYQDALRRLLGSRDHEPSEAIDLIVEGSGGKLSRKDVIYAVLKNSSSGGVEIRDANAIDDGGTTAYRPSDAYIREEAAKIDSMLTPPAAPSAPSAPAAPAAATAGETSADRVRSFIKTFLRPADRPAGAPASGVFDAPHPADPIRAELDTIGDISSASMNQLGAIKSKLAALRSVAQGADPSIASAVMQDIDNSLAAVDARANEVGRWTQPPAPVAAARSAKEIPDVEDAQPFTGRAEPTPSSPRYSFDSPSGMPAGIAGVHLDMDGAQELRRLLDGKMFDVADQNSASVRPIGKPEVTVEEIDPRQVSSPVRKGDFYVEGTKPVRRVRVTVRQKHSGGVDAVRTVEGDLARPGEGGSEGMATVAFAPDGVAKFYRPGDFAASTPDAKQASRMTRAGEDEAMALTAGSVDVTQPTPGPGRSAAEREYKAGQTGGRTSRRAGGRQPQRPDGENAGYGAIREDEAAGLQQVDDAADDVESTARGGRADAAQRVRKARATARSASKDAEAARQEAQAAREELARARSGQQSAANGVGEAPPADPTGKPVDSGSAPKGDGKPSTLRRVVKGTAGLAGIVFPAYLAGRLGTMGGSEMAYGASPSIDDPNMSPEGDETDTIKRSEDVLQRLGRARQNSYLTTQRPLPY